MEQLRALEILAQHQEELKKMGVKSLALFGSVARGEAKPDSDIDILVELARPMGMIAFVRIQNRLGELLGRHVDLVTPNALKRQLRDRIINEASHACQGLEV
jgi:hypothetical protein